jgi:hypothetical protein
MSGGGFDASAGRKKKSQPTKGCVAPPLHYPGWSIGGPRILSYGAITGEHNEASRTNPLIVTLLLVDWISGSFTLSLAWAFPLVTDKGIDNRARQLSTPEAC